MVLGLCGDRDGHRQAPLERLLPGGCHVAHRFHGGHAYATRGGHAISGGEMEPKHLYDEQWDPPAGFNPPGGRESPSYLTPGLHIHIALE